jgi:ArsR family transcriptional regulator, zinc-responsive transcriptional repressor
MDPPPSPVDHSPFNPVYVEAAARILGVLRNPTRLHLVLLVAQGETHVSQLSELLGLPQSNVSHHLAILRNLGLVEARREGQFVLYSLNIGSWRLLADGFFDHLLAGQDQVRLQNFLVRREPDGEPMGSRNVDPDPSDREPRAGKRKPKGKGKRKRKGKTRRTE